MCKKTVINNLDEFIFGKTPFPVQCGHDVTIGAGNVIPEINFTLPPMLINDETWPKVIENYNEMIDGVLKRAVHLQVPQLLVEFETLPDMTNRPEWGLEITRLLADKIKQCHDLHGLKGALRLTINDTREFSRPPILRHGKYWDTMVQFLEGAAEAGADMIAIESTGGKEICDEALVNCDIRTVIFALGILGARDMDFLWRKIVDICEKGNMIPSGDSACGFANTAMVLADQRLIPQVFAALTRVVSVPRSLVAIDRGAKGPTKDCAYEGPFLKAISGVPISMEGRSAACAHMSTIGNISQAVCDCWSNESVQNVQLLSGKAPIVSMEQLAYDCRLMETASAHSHHDALKLRDWLTESDAPRDPQAFVLRPDVVLEISNKIIEKNTPYEQTVAGAIAAIEAIKQGSADGRLAIRQNELNWLQRLEDEVRSLPDEDGLIEEMLGRPDITDKFLPEEYGLQQNALV